MGLIRISFFPNGATGPVRDFLEALARERPQAWTRLTLDLEILGAEGLRSGRLTIRPMGDGLWEIKRNFDGINYRIFFCMGSGQAWLLHAIEKKQAKTPLKDIRLARRRMAEVS